MMSGEPTTNVETIARFLDAQYGTAEGTAYLTHGHGEWIDTEKGRKYATPDWAENGYTWPSERDVMARNALMCSSEGEDVWFCTTLRRGRSRKVSVAVERHRLHADIDRALTDEDARKLGELGAWVVDSGTAGHAHAYIELDRDVDADEFRTLEDSMCAWLEADSKKADNDVLRIPGTLNYKHDPPNPVTWDGYTGQKKWNPAELLEFLPAVERPDVEGGDITAERCAVDSFDGALREAIRNDSGDRSEDAFAIMKQASKSGLSKGQCKFLMLSLIKKVDRYADKYARKTEAQLDAEIHKAYAWTNQERQEFYERTVAEDWGALEGSGRTAEEILQQFVPNGTTDEEIEDAIADEATGPETSWDRIDLRAIITGEYQPIVPTILPRSDGQNLIYPGKTHSFHGEYESGKSLVLQYASILEMNQGHNVLYVDFESDAQAVVNRLLEFGADPEMMAEHFYYIRPVEPHDRSHPRWQALMEVEFTLAVLDGVTEAMSLENKEITDNKDVADWQRMLPNYIVDRTGAAVCLIDHVTKSSDTRGRSAIGGQHKMAGLSGAAYVVEPEEMPKRGGVGVIGLRVAKDREGQIRPNCGAYRKGDRTQGAARIVIDSTGEKPKVAIEMFRDPISAENEVDVRLAMATTLVGNRPGISKGEASAILTGKVQDGCGGLRISAKALSDMWAWLELMEYIRIEKQGHNKHCLYLLKPYVPEGSTGPEENPDAL